MERLQRILKVKPDEAAPVLILSLYYFFITATYVVGRAARDTFFLSRFNNDALPYVMVMVPIVATITIFIYSRLSRWLSIIPLVSGIGIFFALTFILIQFSLSSDVAVVFLYVWVEVVSTVIFFQFWLVAGMVFDTRQAKRLFGLIGVGGAISYISVGLGLQPFIAQIGSEFLLIMTAALSLMWVLMAWMIRPYLTHAPRREEDNNPIQGSEPLYTNYIKTIMVVIGITIFAATVIDYQYKVIAKENFPNQDDLASFFLFFSATVGVLMLIMRLFFVGRILNALGIMVGLLLLPLSVISGSVAIIIAPILASAVLTKGADQVFRYTIHESAIELAWVPIDSRRKLKVKPIVNGTWFSILQGAAALTILGLTQIGSLQPGYLSAVILVLAAIWLPAIFYLRRGYISQLMNSIQKRELKFEDMTFDVTDNVLVNRIHTDLVSGDEAKQAFTLEIIGDLNLTPWRADLQTLMRQGSFPIRQRVLQLASDIPDVVSDEEVIAIIRQGNELLDEALIVAARRHLSEVVPLLQDHLYSPQPEIRAAAAKATLMMKEGPVDEARKVFESMLQERNTGLNTLALNMLVDMPDEFPKDLMGQYLHRNTTQVLSLSLTVARQLQGRDNGLAIADIAHNLRRARTAFLARRVLANYDEDEVIAVLVALYTDPSAERRLKMGILQAFRDYPTSDVIDLIVSYLSEDDIAVFGEAVATLLDIARLQGLRPEVVQALETHKHRVARFIYARYQTLSFIEQPRNESLIVDLLYEDIAIAVPALLRLSIMDKPDTPIETVIYSIQHQYSKRSNTLEIMDNIFSREERDIILPIFEDMDIQERCRLGRRHYQDLPKSLGEEMLNYIHHTSDPWRSSLGLDYSLRHYREDLLRQVDWKAILRLQNNKALIMRNLAEDGHFLREIPDFPAHTFPETFSFMTTFSTLEKTILLKQVKLFENIPARDISHLAQIAKEVTLPAGEVLFKEGDEGDSMYFITLGEVRVHVGEREFARLGRGNVLGEMAILDQEPRSASVTALSDSVLLRIDRDDFYDLMASRLEIMQGIIRMLSSRLRNTLKAANTEEHITSAI